MNRVWIVAAAGAAGVLAQGALAQNFTPGNLVVSRVGTGAAALSAAASPVSLIEYTTGGSQIGSSLDLPAAGPSNRLTLSGSANSEGFLTLSTDGRYLTIGGYNADAGTATVVSASGVNRDVARVAFDRSVDLTTSLSDAYIGSNFRSVASTDGTAMWGAGTASSAANAGVRAFNVGAASSTQISSTPTNIRVVNIFNGQVYATTQSGAFIGVNAVGSGLQTGSGNTTTLAIGTGTASTSSPYDFFFSDPNTCYIADDGNVSTGNGGLQKWTFNGSAWSLAYIMRTNLTAGLRGLTGVVNGNSVTLYATTADSITASAGNKLVAVTDAGAASPFTVLATAPGNEAFRGVDFAPTPAPGAVSLLGLAGLLASRRRR